MWRMVARWYGVIKQWSGPTSTTYLRWMVARLNAVIDLLWISHLMCPAKRRERLQLMLSPEKCFLELLVSQALNIVSNSYFYLCTRIVNCIITVEPPISGHPRDQKKNPHRSVRLWEVKNGVFVCSWEHDQVSAHERCLLAEVRLYFVINN